MPHPSGPCGRAVRGRDRCGPSSGRVVEQCGEQAGQARRVAPGPSRRLCLRASGAVTGGTVARGGLRGRRGRRARSRVRCRTDPADRPIPSRRPGRDRPAAAQAGARRPPPLLPATGPARRDDLPGHPGNDRRPHARRPQRRAHGPPARVRDQGGGVPQAAEPARRPRRDGPRQRTPQPRRAEAGDRALSERERRDEVPARGRVPRAAATRIPEPLVNTQLAGFEVDFLWPEQMLVVEIDGGGHERPTAQRKDALEDRVLRGAGYTVLRACRTPTSCGDRSR